MTEAEFYGRWMFREYRRNMFVKSVSLFCIAATIFAVALPLNVLRGFPLLNGAAGYWLIAVIGALGVAIAAHHVTRAVRYIEFRYIPRRSPASGGNLEEDFDGTIGLIMAVVGLWFVLSSIPHVVEQWSAMHVLQQGCIFMAVPPLIFGIIHGLGQLDMRDSETGLPSPPDAGTLHIFAIAAIPVASYIALGWL